MSCSYTGSMIIFETWFQIRGDTHGAQIVKPANWRDTNHSQFPRQRPVRSSQVPNTGAAVQQEVQGPVGPQVILTSTVREIEIHGDRKWKLLRSQTCVEILTKDTGNQVKLHATCYCSIPGREYPSAVSPRRLWQGCTWTVKSWKGMGYEMYCCIW